MAKQNINVGTAANDKKGDSLRAAFQKVNANFTELYTELGLVNDVTLSLGAFEFAGSTISTTDSSAIVIDQATTVTSNLSVGGDIVPQTAYGGDLGSSTLPWRSLYVSQSTIYLGGTALSIDSQGNLLVGGQSIADVGTAAWNSITGKPTFATVATTGAYADLTGKPTIPTLVSQLANDSGFLTSVGNISNIQSEGNINIEVNLTDSTKRIWQFGEDGSLTLPEGGRINALGYNNIVRLGNDGFMIANGSIFNENETGLSINGQNSDAGTYIQIPGRTASENGEPLIISHNWDADINIQGGGGTWSFGFDGALTIPGKIRVDEYLTRSNLTAYDQTSGYGGAGGPNALSIMQSDWPTANIDIPVGAEITSPTFNTATVTSPVIQGPTSTWIIPIGTTNATAFTSTIDISYVVNKTWTFGNDGSITFPDATIQSTAWTGFSVAADDSTQRLISSGELIKFTGAGGITTASDAEGNITITGSGGGAATGIESETDVSIRVNLTDSTQRIWQFGEDGDTVFPNNVSINYSGNNIQFPRIIADSGKAFSVQAQGTSGSAALSWTVNPDAAGQYAAVAVSKGGGDNLAKVILQAQSDSGDAGTAKIWKFDETGKLTLPTGGVIEDSGNYIKLTPPTGSANQSLLIYPTAGDGNHIHLTAGGGSTELYLGNDIHYVKLVNGGNVEVRANNGVNDAAWTFGTDGALTIPGDIKSNGNINIEINLSDSTLRRWQFGEDGELTFPDNTISTGKGITLPVNESITVNLPYTAFGGGTHTFKINPQSIKLPNGNGVIFAGDETAANEWNLDSSNKLLSFPDAGDGVYPKILYSDPNNNGIGMELLTFAKSIKITAASNKSWTFGTDGALTLPGDIKSDSNINIDINIGDSTLRRWQFGEDGELTVPGPINGLGNSKLDFTTYGANTAYLTTTSNDATALFMGAVSAELYAQTNILIRTNTDGTSKQWTFGDDGSLTLPGKITLPNGAVIKDTEDNAVAFGQSAGLTSQGQSAVAIGTYAGNTSQGQSAVAIGTYAGNLGQSLGAISIGPDAGQTNQGTRAIAIGALAGPSNQGQYSIAIGYGAGNGNAVANSIIINATGSNLVGAAAGFYVAPIRNISATSGVLQYNATTKEVSYSNSVTAESFDTDQITVVGNRISTTVTNANLELECNGTGGVVINTLAEATTASTARSAGYLGIPASTVSTTNTLTIADAGEHIYVTTNGQTITIPANASVAYPIGTTLTFIAGPSPVVTVSIAITSDTLRLAGGTSTGTRTLAANGMATAVKVAATTWYINGTGLT